MVPPLNIFINYSNKGLKALFPNLCVVTSRKKRGKEGPSYTEPLLILTLTGLKAGPRRITQGLPNQTIKSFTWEEIPSWDTIWNNQFGGLPLLERSSQYWWEQDEHEPAVSSGSIKGQPYAKPHQQEYRQPTQQCDYLGLLGVFKTTLRLLRPVLLL